MSINKRIHFVIISLFLSFSALAFEAVLVIKTNPSDAEIWIDGEKKGYGSYNVILESAREVKVMVKKEGFKTRELKYIYKKAECQNCIPYKRGKNNDLDVIVLEKDENTSSPYINSDLTEDQLRVHLDNFKSDDYLTKSEAFVLKFDIDDKKANSKEAVIELLELTKFLKSGFISKSQFNVVKARIINHNYDFTENKKVSVKLRELQIKEDKAQYSKEEVKERKDSYINNN